MFDVGRMKEEEFEIAISLYLSRDLSSQGTFNLRIEIS